MHNVTITFDDPKDQEIHQLRGQLRDAQAQNAQLVAFNKRVHESLALSEETRNKESDFGIWAPNPTYPPDLEDGAVRWPPDVTGYVQCVLHSQLVEVQTAYAAARTTLADIDSKINRLCAQTLVSEQKVRGAERAAIVKWLSNAAGLEVGCMIDAIEAGEHLK